MHSLQSTSARLSRLLLAMCLLSIAAFAGDNARVLPVESARPTIDIPRIDKAPTVDDYLSMGPSAEFEGKLAKVENFIQRNPTDGVPATEKTDVYLGYDSKNLYVVFVAFDSEPDKVRAHMARREDVFSDDIVQILLDTYQDERRAYSFITNPLGVQWDAIYTEGSSFDQSFDTVWESDGKLTDQGFVVTMAIPFRSLRFPPEGGKLWGMMFNRDIRRKGEETFWPQNTTKVQGRMNQAGFLRGIEEVTVGRNMQFIPYGIVRNFRSLDTRDAGDPRFESKSADVISGLDSKFVIQDRLVLDVTVNPDFSQVEADQPQSTVNQRFEVLFPEKRPFFLENANYFRTPIDLAFTRRIADPQFGIRMTGKLGRYAIGALLVDDEFPGKAVAEDHEIADERAYFGIFRVNRDVGNKSSVGLVYAERRFHGSTDTSLPERFQTTSNKVGGIDWRFALPAKWITLGQALASSTDFRDGTHLAGPAYRLRLERESRHGAYNVEYNQNSPGFRTQSGTFRRTDIQRTSQFANYRWRPEGKALVAFGPNHFSQIVYDTTGRRLDWEAGFDLVSEWRRGTVLGGWMFNLHERLRPGDAENVVRDMDFQRHSRGIFFDTQYFKWMEVHGEVAWNRTINFNPLPGLPPEYADSNSATLNLIFRPIDGLVIDNRYIVDHFDRIHRDQTIYSSHIFFQKWNYQINRKLSVRLIGQYDAVLPHASFTSLERTKKFNGDVLVSYLVNPWTALHVGYNSNHQNLNPALCERLPGSGRCADPDASLLRTRNQFLQDGRQFFIKLSYLLRY